MNIAGLSELTDVKKAHLDASNELTVMLSRHLHGRDDMDSDPSFLPYFLQQFDLLVTLLI